MPKVLVGISGGVDSSVAALLLKNSGYDVEGVLLKQLNEPESCETSICCGDSAISRARALASQVGIHLHTPDVRALFHSKVINPSISEFKKGHVPSPCTSCNSKVRAPMLNYYREVLQCDFFATGHYFTNNAGSIYRGTDHRKDQSYMVALVAPSLLQKWITPLGHLTKKEVRELAQQAGLVTATTPDSQDLCFNHLLPNIERDVVKDLVKIGKYSGRPAIGQRKGFNGLSVTAVTENTVTLGRTAPTSATLMVDWVNKPDAVPDMVAQIAYHGYEHPITSIEDNLVTLARPVTTNPGQVMAVYKNNQLIGGGVIKEC